MIFAKFLIVLFSFTYLFGFLWFGGKFSIFTYFVIWLIVISSLTISFFPKKYLALNNFKWGLIALCFIDVLLIIYLIFQDFYLVNGPDLTAIILRLIFLISVVIVTIDGYKATHVGDSD